LNSKSHFGLILVHCQELFIDKSVSHNISINRVKTNPGAHPASCSMVPGVFPESKVAELWQWPWPCLVPRLRKGTAIPLLSICACMACYRETFTLNFTFTLHFNWPPIMGSNLSQAMWPCYSSSYINKRRCIRLVCHFIYILNFSNITWFPRAWWTSTVKCFITYVIKKCNTDLQIVVAASSLTELSGTWQLGKKGLIT